MEKIVPGYVYELEDFSKKGDIQTLSFYERKLIEIDLDDTSTYEVKSGTTTEAVLEVLIDRLKYLNAIMPSIYNEDAIDYLRHALQCLNDRTEDRVARDVEGTDRE